MIAHLAVQLSTPTLFYNPRTTIQQHFPTKQIRTLKEQFKQSITHSKFQRSKTWILNLKGKFSIKDTRLIPPLLVIVQLTIPSAPLVNEPLMTHLFRERQQSICDYRIVNIYYSFSVQLTTLSNFVLQITRLKLKGGKELPW